MNIRKFRSSDVLGAAKVISETYGMFNKKEGSKSEVMGYINHFSPDKGIKSLNKIFATTSYNFVAIHKDRVVGIVRGNKNRIVNLYVLGNYHGRRLGKDLLSKFEDAIKKDGSKYIKTRASLYATKFYFSQGYKKTTGVRKFRGRDLRFQPMIKCFP